MTDQADQAIAALRSGYDDLSAYVVNLDESGLAGPSGAAEWSVAQVLSHLGSGAEINLAVVEFAEAGGKAPDGFNQSVWDRWNAMGPVRQRDGFIEANRRLVEKFEGFDAATRDGLRIDVGFLPAPISAAELAGMRLAEFALHAWDVRAAALPRTPVAAEAVPLLLDSFGFRMGWISRPQTLGGRQARLAVELTDPPAAYGLTVGEQVELGEPPAQPDGVVRAPAEAWLRLLTGRLAPQWTPAGVSVEGPISLDDLRRLFPGF